jgi:uncharacterized protein YndB with AHSA1/START domain
MSQSITLAVNVDAEPGRVFEILSTNEGQRAFWTADCDVSADRARFGFPHTTVDVEVDVITQPSKLVRMRVTSCPPGSGLENSTWEYELSESSAGENSTAVLFRAYGVSEGYSEYDLARRAQTWALILDRLSNYVTSGAPQPYSSVCGLTADCRSSGTEGSRRALRSPCRSHGAVRVRRRRPSRRRASSARCLRSLPRSRTGRRGGRVRDR